MVNERHRSCVVLVGPEDTERIRFATLGLAPRLDYRLVARLLDAQVVQGYPPPSGIRNRRWFRRTNSFVGNLKVATQLLRQLPAGGVVYSTGETWGLPVALVGSTLRKRQFKHVIYAHRVYSPNWLWFLNSCSRWLAVDGWICVTRHQARLLRGSLGIEPWRVTAICQGVDTAFFDPEKADPVRAKDPYLLSVGIEMRNYGLLFEAVRSLDIDVVVKASSAWMAQGRTDHGVIPANVKIISQRLSYLELRDLYGGAALVVVPLCDTSQAAGVTTILEAMATEKPVIATRSAGLPDALVADRTGVVTEPNAAGLGGAILAMLDSDQKIERMVIEAREAVTVRYSIEEHAAKVADFVRQIVTERGA